MRRTAFDQYRDRRIADEVSDEAAADAALRCREHGCMQPWSVNGMCSTHYRRTVGRPHSSIPLASKLAILERLRRSVEPRPAGTGWAQALRDREEAGEVLPSLARRWWREALRVGAKQDDGDVLLDVADRRDAMGRKVAAYAEAKGIAL